MARRLFGVLNDVKLGISRDHFMLEFISPPDSACQLRNNLVALVPDEFDIKFNMMDRLLQFIVSSCISECCSKAYIHLVK